MSEGCGKLGEHDCFPLSLLDALVLASFQLGLDVSLEIDFAEGVEELKIPISEP